MRCRISVTESGPHPDSAVTHLGGTGRHVVGPQIEGAATREIEAGVVPVAGQGPILDATAIQRKANMRATTRPVTISTNATSRDVSCAANGLKQVPKIIEARTAVFPRAIICQPLRLRRPVSGSSHEGVRGDVIAITEKLGTGPSECGSAWRPWSGPGTSPRSSSGERSKSPRQQGPSPPNFQVLSSIPTRSSPSTSQPAQDLRPQHRIRNHVSGLPRWPSTRRFALPEPVLTFRSIFRLHPRKFDLIHRQKARAPRDDRKSSRCDTR